MIKIGVFYAPQCIMVMYNSLLCCFDCIGKIGTEVHADIEMPAFNGTYAEIEL